MTRQNGKTWRLNRTVNLSVLVQLAFLASLIVGSWVNLQRQLDSLQRDVTSLLESQKRSAEKVEQLSERNVSFEYRLRAIEKQFPQTAVSMSEGGKE
jgi:septal ring factor EnvC (AmiA/AmiB activator)